MDHYHPWSMNWARVLHCLPQIYIIMMNSHVLMAGIFLFTADRAPVTVSEEHIREAYTWGLSLSPWSCDCHEKGRNCHTVFFVTKKYCCLKCSKAGIPIMSHPPFCALCLSLLASPLPFFPFSLICVYSILIDRKIPVWILHPLLAFLSEEKLHFASQYVSVCQKIKQLRVIL